MYKLLACILITASLPVGKKIWLYNTCKLYTCYVHLGDTYLNLNNQYNNRDGMVTLIANVTCSLRVIPDTTINGTFIIHVVYYAVIVQKLSLKNVLRMQWNGLFSKILENTETTQKSHKPIIGGSLTILVILYLTEQEIIRCNMKVNFLWKGR
jgi:hypothetical protein